MSGAEVQVIIPVYKAEKGLRKCLDSLKAQTFTNWEALMVDDASPDGSLEIMREYARSDPRFVCIEREINSGAAGARNAALERLTAEYAAFLDSDDFWEADMLETLITRARETDCDVIQCRYVFDFPGGRSFAPRGVFPGGAVLRGPELKKVYIKMMTGINMNHVCMKLIKNSVIGGLKFDTGLRTAEDLKFSVGVFKNVQSFCFVDKVLYHYVRGETSLTGSGLGFREKLAANRSVARYMAEALPGWGIDTPFYRLLTRMRPYIIIFSKVFRMLQEKLLRKE